MDNALISYTRYIDKLLWPANLSVYYPFVFHWPAWRLLLAIAVLPGVTAGAWRLRRDHPYFLAGWLWFVGTLFPVMGLSQTGLQALADRFTYIPSIGFCMIIVWGGAELAQWWHLRPALRAAGAGAMLLLCAAESRADLGYWCNSGTLFCRALALDPDNYLAHGSYGAFLTDLGLYAQARQECQRAVEIAPYYSVGYKFLGDVLEKQGQTNEAIAALQRGLRIYPQSTDQRVELAKLLLQAGKNDEAEIQARQGLAYEAGSGPLHLCLGYALARRHELDGAEREFALAVRLEPAEALAHYEWARVLALQRKQREAITQYREALKLHPDFPDVLNNLAWMLAASDDPSLRNGPEAVALASRACTLTHTNEALRIGTLANAYAAAGRFDEAVAWAQKARSVALAHGQNGLAEQNLKLQNLYERHQAFVEGPKSGFREGIASRPPHGP